MAGGRTAEGDILGLVGAGTVFGQRGLDVAGMAVELATGPFRRYEVGLGLAMAGPPGWDAADHMAEVVLLDGDRSLAGLGVALGRDALDLYGAAARFAGADVMEFLTDPIHVEPAPARELETAHQTSVFVQGKAWFKLGMLGLGGAVQIETLRGSAGRPGPVRVTIKGNGLVGAKFKARGLVDVEAGAGPVVERSWLVRDEHEARQLVVRLATADLLQGIGVDVPEVPEHHTETLGGAAMAGAQLGHAGKAKGEVRAQLSYKVTTERPQPGQQEKRTYDIALEGIAGIEAPARLVDAVERILPVRRGAAGDTPLVQLGTEGAPAEAVLQVGHEGEEVKEIGLKLKGTVAASSAGAGAQVKLKLNPDHLKAYGPEGEAVLGDLRDIGTPIGAGRGAVGLVSLLGRHPELLAMGELTVDTVTTGTTVGEPLGPAAGAAGAAGGEVQTGIVRETFTRIHSS